MPKIRAVHIKNFESHSDSFIELSPDINVIAGLSDSGKSSIYRAIFWLVNNEPSGNSFIRHGSDSCSVKIELDNGFQIIREKWRNGSVNRYIIVPPSGETSEYNSIGSSPVPEVWKVLGVGDFLLPGEKRVSLNFSQQGEAPFCVFDSGPEKARKLSSFVDLHKSDSAIRGLTAESRASAQRAEALKNELSDIQNQLDAFPPLERMEELLERGDRALSDCIRAGETVEELSEVHARYLKLTDGERLLASYLSRLEYLEKEIPDVPKLEGLFADIVFLQRLDDDYQRLVLMEDRLSAFISRISAIEEPDLDEMRELSLRLELMEGFYEKFLENSKNTADIEGQISILESKILENTENYRKLLSEAGVCPVCNQVIDEECLGTLHV